MASSQRHFPDHQRSNSHEEELCSEYDNELCGGEYGFVKYAIYFSFKKKTNILLAKKIK